MVLPCCLSAQYVSRMVRWPTAGHILYACPELLNSSLIGPSRERGRSPSGRSGSTPTPPGPSVFLLPRLDQTSPPIIGSRHPVNAAKIRHHVQIGRGPTPGILKGHGPVIIRGYRLDAFGPWCFRPAIQFDEIFEGPSRFSYLNLIVEAMDMQGSSYKPSGFVDGFCWRLHHNLELAAPTSPVQGDGTAEEAATKSSRDCVSSTLFVHVTPLPGLARPI